MSIQNEILRSFRSKLSEQSTRINDSSDFLFIGELAERLNVNPKTIRYYEREELITPTRHGKFRIYFNQDVERLRVILAMRKLGVSIANIKAFSELESGVESKGEITKILNDHLAVLVKQLQTTQEQLSMTRQVMDEFATQGLISAYSHSM